MDEFDEWLKANHLVRTAQAAAMLDLSDNEFKCVIKRGFIKRIAMPNHDNLVSFPADLSLTKDQHQQLMNEGTLNAHQVAEELGVTQKEFNEVRRRSNVAHTDEILGRTIPNDTGISALYSRADVEKLRPVAVEVKVIKPVVKPVSHR